MTTLFYARRPLFSAFVAWGLLTFSASAVAAEPSLSIDVFDGKAADGLLTNVRNYLAIKNESCALSARRERTLRNSIHNKIPNALQAFGYYNATWELDIQRQEDCWQALLRMTLGPRTQLDQVTIRVDGEAATDPAFSAVLETTRLTNGAFLNHGNYDAFKSRLNNLAQQRGYRDAQFTQAKLSIYADRNQADVELVFHSGPRYQFGQVSYDQDVLDEALLNRYLPFSPGDPFDITQLGALQQALNNTQYFDRVTVEQLDVVPGETQIPIQVSLTPIAKHETSLGIGLATDTGMRASVGFDNKRVNQRGHKYETDLTVSELASSASFAYQLPLQDPTSETLRYSAQIESEDTDSFASDTWSLGVSKTHLLSNQWIRTEDLVYQVESFTIADERETTALLIPGLGFYRSDADSVAYPRHGWRLEGRVRGAVEQVLSDLSFVQLQGSAKYIFPLGNGRVLTRVTSGTTLVSDFDELPTSVRYFAGGDSSVRGFEYESLGPTDADGDVIGGKHLLTSSIEYDHPIRDNYSIAAFYDAGNAFDNSDFDLQQSVGFGARWFSPVGPIRLDLAFPFDSDTNVRLHITMGPDI